MKQKILLAAVVAVCFAVVATGTLAYFTEEDTAHNVITSGGVTIELVEQTRGEGDAVVDFPEEGIKGVMPGAAVSKIVKVKNTGKGEAWIRVKIESSITGADGNPLPTQLSDGTPVMSYTVESGWKEKDGCYYYEKSVAPDSFTEIVCEEVIFAPAMGNEYQNCTANIMIYAQAVQTANNPIPAGGDATDVVGWPAE